MTTIPLEDNFEDILGKALRGTGIADGILEFLTGVPEETIVKLKDGEFEEDALRKVYLEALPDAPPDALPDALLAAEAAAGADEEEALPDAEAAANIDRISSTRFAAVPAAAPAAASSAKSSPSL